MATSQRLPHGVAHDIHLAIVEELDRLADLALSPLHRTEVAAAVLDAALTRLERHEWGLVAWPDQAGDGTEVRLVYPGGIAVDAETVFRPGCQHDLPIYVTGNEGVTVTEHARVVVLPEWAGRVRANGWRAAKRARWTRKAMPVRRARLGDTAWLASTIVWWAAATADRLDFNGDLGKRLSAWATLIEDAGEDRHT